MRSSMSKISRKKRWRGSSPTWKNNWQSWDPILLLGITRTSRRWRQGKKHCKPRSTNLTRHPPRAPRRVPHLPRRAQTTLLASAKTSSPFRKTRIKLRTQFASSTDRFQSSLLTSNLKWSSLVLTLKFSPSKLLIWKEISSVWEKNWNLSYSLKNLKTRTKNDSSSISSSSVREQCNLRRNWTITSIKVTASTLNSKMRSSTRTRPRWACLKTLTTLPTVAIYFSAPSWTRTSRTSRDLDILDQMMAPSAQNSRNESKSLTGWSVKLLQPRKTLTRASSTSATLWDVTLVRISNHTNRIWNKLTKCANFSVRKTRSFLSLSCHLRIRLKESISQTKFPMASVISWTAT